MREGFGGGEVGIASILFGHNSWANVRLLDACEGLTDEQLDAKVPGTYGSVREMLLHIVASEARYLPPAMAREPGEAPRSDEVFSVERLRQDARSTGEKLLRLALDADPSLTVQQTWAGKLLEYPLAGVLAQVIHHGNEHRAQVATALTQQGGEPPNMSVWQYMEEMGLLVEAVQRHGASE